MTCQTCAHANREDTKMSVNGYIRCAVANEKSHYMSAVIERVCKDFREIGK